MKEFSCEEQNKTRTAVCSIQWQFIPVVLVRATWSFLLGCLTSAHIKPTTFTCRKGGNACFLGVFFSCQRYSSSSAVSYCRCLSLCWWMLVLCTLFRKVPLSIDKYKILGQKWNLLLLIWRQAGTGIRHSASSLRHELKIRRMNHFEPVRNLFFNPFI